MINRKTPNLRLSSERGFTLIELLVVIGIISILAGGIGLALRDGNPSAALRSAQAIVATQITAARGQAALSGADSRIAIYADVTTDDRYLRSVRVLVKATTSPETWKYAGDEILLPAGTYFIPKTTGGLPGATFESGWDGDVVSSMLTSSTPATLTMVAGLPVLPKSLFLNNFSSIGTISGGGGTLAVGSATRGPTGLTFQNSAMARGVKISTYGITTMLDQTEAFK